ncbi:unnamed protein product [Phytophthora lilii]|uniref:Unnamed protein product n=1 Tax=Phytophthora lilii TaxID=2077276 RepID=A0A9W6TDH3_9STRA|nr:unnamed protein product [Phytophthora lilii]
MWIQVKMKVRRASSLACRQNLALAGSEAYPVAVPLAESGDGYGITVLKKLPGETTVSKRNVARTLPAELKHRPQAVIRATADGAAAQEISRLHVAPRDGVVHKLLLHVPVHVAEVALGHGISFVRALRLDRDLQYSNSTS